MQPQADPAVEMIDKFTDWRSAPPAVAADACCGENSGSMRDRVGIVVLLVGAAGEFYSAGVISLSVTHLWLVISIPSTVRSTMYTVSSVE